MKFGCCCPIEQAGLAHTAGFDFVECPLVSLQAEQDETVFAPIRERYAAAPLPTPAFNMFLPGDLKVVGPAVDQNRVQCYVQTALKRAHQLGAQVIVFGSGRARNVPDDFSRATANAQLVDFLTFTGPIAQQQGITIAIEPLNRRESNILNSVAEAVTLAQQVNHPAVRVLADFYHMDEEQEPLSEITRHQAWLAHIHVADTERRAPGTGHYPYATFVEQLRQAGYQGMISVECRWDDFAAEAGSSVQFLHRAFATGR
jgi:sugar phosphate isomerase/epimerase